MACILCEFKPDSTFAYFKRTPTFIGAALIVSTLREIQAVIQRQYLLLLHKQLYNLIQIMGHRCKAYSRYGVTTYFINLLCIYISYVYACLCIYIPEKVDFFLFHLISHFVCPYLNLFCVDIEYSAFLRYVK